MNNPVSRQELYDAIDRQNDHLESVLDRGFQGLNQRMDIANGRTSKLEDRMITNEKDVAVLLDRAIQAEHAAMAATKQVGNTKWWASAAAGVVVTVVEIFKAVFTAQ